MYGYTGEIRLVAFNFPPKGYIVCDGRTLRKEQFQDLYRVIGDTFNTTNTNNTLFQIPDLRDRFVMQPKSKSDLGKKQGKTTVELSLNQMPEHNHSTRIEVDNTSGGEEPVNAPKDAFLNNQAGVFSIAPSADTFLGGISQNNVGDAEPINIQNANIKMMYVIRYKLNDLSHNLIGEIRIWPNSETNNAINRIPNGWRLCNGDTIKSTENPALYSIIGYNYGGSIASNQFKLPDFTNKFASGSSDAAKVGETGGKTSIRIELGQLPSHNHNVKLAVNNDADSTPHVQIPNNAFINSNAGVFSSEISILSTLGGISEENKGGFEEIDITNPSLGLNYIICTEGVHNVNTESRTLGEIIMYAGFRVDNSSVAICKGQLYNIDSHQSLFSLLGKRYGGNSSSFNIPNLINKIPLSTDSSSKVGVSGGANSITLTPENLPPYNHNVQLAASISGDGRKVQIPNGILNKDAGLYSTKSSENAFLGGLKEDGFAGEPIDIRNPFLVINFLIALDGLFPDN